MMNILDINELKPLKELINTIKEFPNEQLNDHNVQMLRNAITSSFDKYQMDMMAQEIRMGYISSGMTEEQVKEMLPELREQLKSAMDEIGEKNDFKRGLIEETLEYIYKVYELAGQLYNGYSTTIRFQKTHPNAILPRFIHTEDACADIYIPEDVVVKANARGQKIDIGLRAAIPAGWELQIRPRSGMSMKTPLRVSNTPGTVDSSFIGPIGILFDNLSGEDYTIKAGDRVAQFALKPVYTFDVEEVENVEDWKQSDRGDAGFGSSGR